MTPGVLSLSGTAFGKETTAGTSVAATLRWRGPMFWPEDTREIRLADEDVAIIGRTLRTYSPFTEAKLTMPDTLATFEQLPILLAGAVKLVTTGVADGSGSGKIYAYTFATTAANTIQTYTVEGYDDNQEYEAEYSFVTDFSLKGATKEPVNVSSTWAARQVTASTKTGALSLSTVEEVLFQKARIYIDTAGGVMGTTIKSLTLIGFEVNVKTGLMPYYAADNQLYFSGHKQANWEVTGKVTFEHDGTATAEYTQMKSQATRLVRIDIDGSTLTTAGTAYSTKKVRLDMPVRWTKYSTPTAVNDNNTVTLDFVSRYDATFGSGPTFTVVNEVTSF